ncbi:benzoylformate decarboxylase [Desulfolutivibrio sulfodismutans]|nr:benzoylformate decarboxylase [Desulfolutivibrio sulfodismutans]QLA14067.1 benzoylformate decarboxylase [Desulfolutivibrio sulfodismutans DSM 3696]
MQTVRDVTFDLLRRLGVTTIVGNPGSTEEAFLADFPSDFQYILALHESCVVGVAEGLSQGLRAPVVVNVHTNAGLGNAMGNLITAALGKTPLIVTAGQQTRAMLLGEPFLANTDAEALPKPWVKWSYEPRRAKDVPAAFMRAYAMAVQPPAGPVFLSLPMDDWDEPMDAVDVFRTVSMRQAPDPERLALCVDLIGGSRNPVLVYGGDVARCGAWEEGVALAERLGAPVWLAPLPERVSFPQNHPLYAGVLPPAIAPLGAALAGHDLVVVIGAPVFRYYPFVPGKCLPDGARLLHITDDPAEAARAVVGDSLLGDAKLVLAALARHVSARPARVSNPSRPSRLAQAAPVVPGGPAPESAADDAAPLPAMTAQQVFAAMSEAAPDACVIAFEAPSFMAAFSQSPIGRMARPDSYYMTASGGLGWAMPAAVGHALAERRTGRNRPVVVIIGDGSFQYAVQSIWTAVQHRLHVTFVALKNGCYGILKSFAAQMGLSGVPGLDIPGIDIAALGKGYGADAHRCETADQVRDRFAAAMTAGGVTVIEAVIG